VRVLREDGAEVSHFELAIQAQRVSLEPKLGLILTTDLKGATRIHNLKGTLLHSLPEEPAVQDGLWIGDKGAFVTGTSSMVRFHDENGSVVAEFEGRILGAPTQSTYPEHTAVAPPEGINLCAPNGEVIREYIPQGDERPLRYCGSRSGRSLLALGTGNVGAMCRCLNAEGEEEWSARVVVLGTLATCISADGSRVVLPASGGLQIRDGAGAEIAHLQLLGGISSAAFDEAGDRIVASSRTGVVRVWDRGGRWLFDLPPHAGACTVGFSADGRRLATVTDSMARLFTTDIDELEDLAARRSTRSLTAAERASYAEILQPNR
jgi:WD40 repeat protein